MILETFLEVPLGKLNVHTSIFLLLERNIGGAIRLPYLGYLIDSRDFNVSRWQLHNRILRHYTLP